MFKTRQLKMRMPPTGVICPPVNKKESCQVRGVVHMLGSHLKHAADGQGRERLGFRRSPTRHVKDWEKITRRAYEGKDGLQTPSEEVMTLELLTWRCLCLYLVKMFVSGCVCLWLHACVKEQLWKDRETR